MEGPDGGDFTHDVHELFERVARRREFACDPPAVQDDDSVGHRVDVKDVVVDEDGRLAPLADALHEVEQLLRLLEREAHGGLVENDDLGVEMECAHDGQSLPLTAGEARDRGVRSQHRRGEAHLLGHESLGDAAHLSDIEEPETLADGAADEDVPPQRLLLGQGALLVDRLDTERPSLGNGQIADDLATEANLAAVRLVDASDDLDERGFARTIVSEQPDDLPGLEVEVDILEDAHATEVLVDASHLEASWLRAGEGRGPRQQSRRQLRRAQRSSANLLRHEVGEGVHIGRVGEAAAGVDGQAAERIVVRKADLGDGLEALQPLLLVDDQVGVAAPDGVDRRDREVEAGDIDISGAWPAFSR